jgi:hypothetical protein
VYPFIDAGVVKRDVFELLEESGLGVPEYYEWRSRSGCYFCFYQQRIEWVGLLERHPELFWAAEAFEKKDEVTGETYTWNSRESLQALAQPQRVQQIKEEHERRQTWAGKSQAEGKLMSILEDEEDEGCLICQL